MKAKRFVSLAMWIALSWMGGFGCASQQDSLSGSSSDSTQRAPTQVTGSYIPRNITQNGPTTDGANDLRIIDRSEIDRSGGADPTQTLRQLGVTH